MVQNAIVGAVGGAVAGGVVGAMNPENLPAKVLVGGMVGGGVSAGTQVAFNVAGGRPWNEGVGTAFGMGFANGAIDAFTDYYGDKLVERAMTPRPARGAVDDVDGWRRPGATDDVDGRLRRWMPEEWDALAVRKAMDVFRDPNASRTERFRAQNRLLDAGVRGPWQGGESLEQMRHRHPTDPDAYWDPTAGKAHEGRWRSRKTGRIVAGDPPEGARTRVGAESDVDIKARALENVDPKLRPSAEKAFDILADPNASPDERWAAKNVLQRLDYVTRLKEQYGIPENVVIKTIDEIGVWEGDEMLRVWLGTRPASGRFDAQGNKIPFEGISETWPSQGMVMRGGAAGEYHAEAQAKGYKPKKVLKGTLGEDAWVPLARKRLQELGEPMPDPLNPLKIEDGLPLMIDYVAAHDGEIMFALHEGIGNSSLTRLELNHILSSPEALSRTTFIVKWYYLNPRNR